MFGRVVEGWHLVVLVVVLLVLFGSKRLPDAARGVGRSLRIFKSELKEMQSEGSTPRPDAQGEVPGSGTTGRSSTTSPEPDQDR